MPVSIKRTRGDLNILNPWIDAEAVCTGGCINCALLGCIRERGAVHIDHSRPDPQLNLAGADEVWQVVDDMTMPSICADITTEQRQDIDYR